MKKVLDEDNKNATKSSQDGSNTERIHPVQIFGEDKYEEANKKAKKELVDSLRVQRVECG